MRHSTHAWILILTVAGALFVSPARQSRGQDSDLSPRSKPPTGDVLTKASDDVRSIFKPLYANKTQAGRKALTKKLLEEAQALTGDPVSRYAMLLEARDVAVQAGDVETAVTAMEAIEAHYAADGMALRLELLEGLSKLVGQLTPDAAAAMSQTAAELVDDALHVFAQPALVERSGGAAGYGQGSVEAARRARHRRAAHGARARGRARTPPR